MTSPPPGSRVPDAPPYGWAALAGLAVFGLYAVTLAPTTAWWDTSEYIATAHILGIPHPPGNPLFVVLARSWSLLLAPLGLAPAVRINLFAAATSAGAAGFWFLVAHRTLAQLRAPARASLVGAAVSVLVGATTYTVWSQSNANEKVYTVSLLAIAATSWLVLRWVDRRGTPGSDRLLVGAAYLMVLGSTSHLMSVLPLAAVLAVVVLGWRWTRDVPALLLRLGLVLVVGLSFNFFLPIRAAQRPVINEADPVCESLTGAAVAVYTLGHEGCPALGASLRREQYQKPSPLTMRQAPFGHQLLNYFQYLDWQWARSVDADEPPGGRRTPITLLFLFLGVAGLVFAYRGNVDTGVYLAVLTVTVSVLLVWYLNFEWGYTLAPEIEDRTIHEVRERDYFFLASFSVWGILAGLGLTGIWLRLRERLPSRAAAAPVLALAFIPLVLNWSWASRAGDYAARDWAYDLLVSVEPYGILFTNGDNDTFPLWYLQEVEGIRRDVTVVVVQYLFTEWYAGQLRELTEPGRQRPYVPVVEGLYTDPTPPEGPVLSLTDEQLAGIRDGLVPEGFTVRFGNVSVEFPEGMFLGRGHYIALAMIAASAHERPIYFAGSGGEMQNVGLAPWGVNHGLATKLVMRDLEAEPLSGLARSGGLGGEWVDVPRTIRLVDEVYMYRGLRTREVWPDAATFNIPAQYYFMVAALSEILDEAGDTARADAYRAMTADFLDAARGGTKAPRSY